MANILASSPRMAALETDLPHPPWHPMYRSFRETVERIQKRYAAAAYAKAKAAIAVKLTEDAAHQQSLHFESSSPATPALTASNTPVHTSVRPVVCETDQLLNTASSRQWKVDTCRPKQLAACKKIIFDGSSLGKLLVVDRTGGGKSHILRMIATMVNGIILVIIPLLSLTADQMANVMNAVQVNGSVEAHNLDDMASSAITQTVIPRMDSIGYHTSSIVFIFSSPQKLVEHTGLLSAITRCHARKTLRLVAIDEAHLYAMHGRSFRVAMRILQRLLFSIVFKVGVWHPLFLAMTATMTTSLLSSFSTLTNVDWTATDNNKVWDTNRHLLWSDAYSFRQRNIRIGLNIGTKMGKALLEPMVDLLIASTTVCVCIFVNFIRECGKWAKILEELLADKFSTVAVLQIHGEQDKNEKFGYMKLYTGHLSMVDFYPRALVATGAANTGFDNLTLQLVNRFGFPRCIPTLLQERGRNARVPGMTGEYNIFTNWVMFVKLALSMLLPAKKDKEVPTECSGVNSAIPTTPQPAPRTSDSQSAMKYPLTKAQNDDNRANAHSDLIDVLHISTLAGLGCIHCRHEWFMAMGYLSAPPEVLLPCNTQCYICDKSYEKYILPVVYSGAIEFLDSRRLNDITPFVLTVDSCEEFVDRLAKDKDWLGKVFGKESVARYNCTAFIFQLLATKILSFELIGGNSVAIVVTQDDKGKKLFKNILQWEGIEFRAKGRGGRTIPFKDIIERIQIARVALEEL